MEISGEMLEICGDCALARDRLSRQLRVAHISPYLPISPHVSPCLAIACLASSGWRETKAMCAWPSCSVGWRMSTGRPGRGGKELTTSRGAPSWKVLRSAKSESSGPTCSVRLDDC